MTHEQATKLIELYGQAWMQRDAELILGVFTPEATYFDPAEGEVRGHAGIKKYWEDKVIASQQDIQFKLLNVWVDSETVIAEWEAHFLDTKRQLNIAMTEVAIFGVDGDRFSSLREYYRSTKTPVK